MRKRVRLFCLLLACVAPAAAIAFEPTWDIYGAALTKGPIRRVGTVMAPTREGKTLRIAGTIAEVCQAKGCWMNVAEGDASIRVEFKDYGFFVPSTAAGKKVQMEGVVIERTLSAEEREHLQSESESGAPIPEHVHVFVASGVKILGGGPIPELQQRRIEGPKPESTPPEKD